MKNILGCSILFIAVYFLSCKPIDIDAKMHDVYGGDSSVFMAGVAIANVTPSSTPNVHDSLYAKTIVLDNGIQRLVFIVVDNQGLPSFVCQAAKDAIHLSTSIPLSNILIASTHTHSGIIAGQEIHYYTRDEEDLLDEHQNLIIDQIAASVTEALSGLQPAKIGWGSVNKPEHVFNRRWYMQNPVYSPYGILDSVKMNPSFQHPDLITPAGPIDPEVSFIAIKSVTDEPIAILANYSLHYVGRVTSGDISADYFGAFGQSIAEYLGADTLSSPFVGVMCNGTSGDINNFNYGASRADLPPYGDIDYVADDIAGTIATAYASTTFHNWVPLRALTKSVSFAKRTPSTQELYNKGLIEANTGAPLFHTQEKTYAIRLNNFMSQYPDSIPVILQTFAIGDLAIGTAPFEIFAETGLELKSSSSFDDTFIIGIGNGHWGYLPTPEQHLKGGYETWITVNRVQEDASEIVVDELLTLFDSM